MRCIKCKTYAQVEGMELCERCFTDNVKKELNVPGKEMVDHPEHYGGDTVYEVIKVLEAWELGFHLGNAVKYIARAGKKGNRLEDLKKARWYLDREIERGLAR